MPLAGTKAGAKGRRAGKPSSSKHRSTIFWEPAVAAALVAMVMAVLLLWAWPAGPHTQAHQCQRLDASTLTSQLFNELVRAGRPAVLVGADSLPELRTAARRWGQRDYLIRAHGDVGLQVSLSASEEFEGVELAAGWPGAERFWSAWRRDEGDDAVGTTTEVLSVAGSRYRPCRTPSSDCVRHIWDRVVVRPASANTTLREVLTRALPGGAAAGYVQYESIPASMLADLRVPAFAAALKAEFAGIWLGRGRTRAQLHHDANENLLLMVRGKKTWRLFPPTAGDTLHEGYMLEVQQQLTATSGTGSGSAAQLERAPVGLSNASLSFFTSPVLLARKSIDIDRFPELKTVDEIGYECELEKGDMIFVPSWWWHEVDTTTESEPTSTSELGPAVDWSAAVNFWFEPYFVKTYGCATCELRENPKHPPLNS